VKPNESYPFRVLVENHTPDAATNATVTIPAPDGVLFSMAKPLGSAAGAATVSPTTVTWTIPSVAAGTADGPTTKTLVVQARAKTLGEDPELVWKDISSTATLDYDGYAGPALTSKSRGPKVIPPSGGFETARYGDKPFPIVPVDYRDRPHEDRHSGDALARVVNAPDFPGSTLNLYQEMSHGQLFPFGDVPSTGIATAGFDYEPGFDFSTPVLVRPDNTPGTCRGTTLGGEDAKQLWGTALYPERISDGWYQLPGDTEYYGGDYPAFLATSGSPVQIDSACGPIGKGVYDAAVIADPEIDYNDFDSDKDGVVDFFMLVFAGLGGNGDSQLNGVPPYDNIWPHSSSLEFYYEDPETGLPGYTSDDRLTSLQGVPQCYTDTSYSQTADCAANGGTAPDDLPAYVRVGPYNVNPESAIDHASVIAHEYGHHLGLPDFYSSYSAYNDWNLMATDFSQHMTVFGKQELGWVVPRFLQPGERVDVADWEEIKNDTGEIEWRRPDGSPYTLSAANGDQGVHNSETYALKLPGRVILPADEVPSGSHVWWSERGNDFGCSPEAGHNLDIALPELASLAAGTPVTLSFKSRWDIEWDFDYGFTLVTTNGRDYASLPSAQGYTTSRAQNPNSSGCLNRHDNGLTGTSASYAAGTQVADRATNTYAAQGAWVDDEYDLTAYAGQSNVVVRLSYFSDPGLDRPGWMVDDLRLTAGSDVLYTSDFETEDDVRFFPGGCNSAGMKTAARCTDGWTRLQGGAKSEQDHGYYLELRDRSGFDFDSRGQADRGALGWAPGVLVEYTDEVRGYGNNGGSQPPRQHYLDSQPQPGFDCGGNIYELDPEVGVLTPDRCQDAAFTAAAGDSRFRDVGWVDNFLDESSDDDHWHFDYGCLTLDVLRMSGDTGNTGALPSDLSADATITADAGCAPYDYGRGGLANGAPTAVADAKPAQVEAGQTVTLDGGGSFDDLQPAGDLTYEWDVDGNGSFDETGQVVTHAYAAAGTYQATLQVTDDGGLSDTDSVTVTVTEPAVTETCVPDDDPRIAYTSGWHRLAASGASGGGFALHTGNSASHSARFEFTVPAGKSGALTYHYATSSKGGSADVFVDGVNAGSVSYAGSAKSAREPDFGPAKRIGSLSAGTHTFELRNMRDAVYVDGLCLEEAGASGSASPTGPGATTSETSSLGIGQQLGSTLTVPVGTQAISVAAESSLGLPIRLLLISPSGSVLAASEASTGLATIDQPVTQAGSYVVKVVNLSLGPLQVWSVATPWGAR
jgi:M6 family metalloprotease-like protein